METGPALNATPRRVVVLAVSSGGGHWLQLCRMAPAWEGCRVVTACSAEAPPMPGHVEHHHRLQDATRWSRRALWTLGWQVMGLLLRYRPDVVVTTGALPGLWAVLGARLTGARAVWIDSLANVQRVSASGRVAGWLAHEWWTQWPHLAGADQARVGVASTSQGWSAWRLPNPFVRGARWTRLPRYQGAVW